jgi:D-3-phosphoglycerate dehydrogenase
MAAVNERFSASGINIDAQYLRTNEDVGYVVIDVDSTASGVALDQLCAVPGTIRCRILY